MEKNTVSTIRKKKALKTPLVALTCYDAASARLIDPHVDIALVGDSLANTRLGYANTLPVTLEEMIHHTRASARGVKSALLVADMPFLSYEAAPWQAAQAAGRLIKQGRAQAVKVEGGRRVEKSIRAILDANIPVMGHLGLTPQSVYKEGGYRVQGRTPAAAKAILDDARRLERFGVFAIVLEGVPAALAARITRAVKIPTIGIGAGAGCDGQILVLDDLLGLTTETPRFVKRYAELGRAATRALAAYRSDVVRRRFPAREHTY